MLAETSVAKSQPSVPYRANFLSIDISGWSVYVNLGPEKSYLLHILLNWVKSKNWSTRSNGIQIYFPQIKCSNPNMLIDWLAVYCILQPEADKYSAYLLEEKVSWSLLLLHNMHIRIRIRKYTCIAH